MFFCCSDNRPKSYHQVITTNLDNQTVVQYISDLEMLDPKVKNSKSTIIRPIVLSEYKEITRELKKNYRQFTDISFPPNQNSLGNIGIENVKWKRIPDFINYPTLVDHKLYPYDVIHKNEGDCYILSAIAALAQNPRFIKNCLHGQRYNQQGVYKVILNVNGVIQEVIVDDYIPLNANGSPIFCQPKIRDLTGQFWTLILEKALAKVKGSYANIMEGTPSDIFRAITYCPSQTFIFNEEDSDKLWEILTLHSGYSQPCCATTKNIISKHSGLISQHTYTVLAVANLTVNDSSGARFGQSRKKQAQSGKKQKVVKLRNPWPGSREQGWFGRASIEDHNFWDSAYHDKEFTFIRQSSVSGDYGVFYIPYEDFIKLFNQVHYCDSHLNTKIASQPLFLDNNAPKGNLYDININERATYTFQLSQAPNHQQTKAQRKQEGCCRASLVLMDDLGGTYRYKAGIMKPDTQNLSFTLQLRPNKYILYALIEPTINTSLYPDSATISIFSSFLAQITPLDSFKCGNLLKQSFLNDGLKYQNRTIQNNGQMSLSCRLLFLQGGFGYIVFHNSKTSDKSFVINYDEQQFEQDHLQVLQPHKHDKNFQIRVTPGHDMIILCRAKNQLNTSWRFPPHLSVKMQPLFG